VDPVTVQHLFLALPYPGGKVSLPSSIRQILAMLASLREIRTPEREVTDGCGRPDIMHRPDNRLPAIQYLPDILQRKHSLIDPMQMDDVCFLKLTQGGNVRTGIGNVNLKQGFPGKVKMQEDT
jgi:hypothetical protein